MESTSGTLVFPLIGQRGLSLRRKDKQLSVTYQPQSGLPAASPPHPAVFSVTQRLPVLVLCLGHVLPLIWIVFLFFAPEDPYLFRSVQKRPLFWGFSDPLSLGLPVCSTVKLLPERLPVRNAGARSWEVN